MLKSFSFGKNQAGVLITLLILISLGASYFFIYVPNNEKVVQERRFRCLRTIDLSIRNKISTSKTQITNLLNNYDKYYKNQQTAALNKLKKYITEYPRTNFTLLLPEQADKYFNNDSLISMGQDTSGTIKYFIDISSQFTFLAKKTTDNPGVKSSAVNKNISGTAIGMRFEFDQFMKPLLLTDVFDYYVVFINKKKIFEGYPTGLNYKNPDSLLNIKSQISTPGIRSLQIGETDYKLFSHPVFTFSDSKWIITGLLKSGVYQQEKNQLPLWVLLLLITAAIAMLVSLPWIKLYHMGNKDRLTTNDGIASVLVSMMLMSLLFFVFFKYANDLKDKKLSYKVNKHNDSVLYPSNSYSRDVLATKVTNALKGEIDTAYNLLSLFDKHYKTTDTDVYLLGQGKGKYDSVYKNHSGNIEIKQVFWLDRYGSEKTNLTPDSNNDPKGHYNERPYFKYPSRYKIGDNEFCLDQVFSFTHGTYRTVISKKTANGVIAMSLTMKSLENVVMPDGYQFAIISNNGWVLYHSKSNRDLFETFKKEFADSTALVSCLEAKSDTSFKTEYYGKRYNVKIKPIQGLPYFTVIFEDLEYNDMRDTEAYVFTFSMLIFMLIFLIIKYSVIFFVSSKRSFFKKQHFDTSWIGPHIKSHHQYNLSILANFLIILMLAIFFNHSSFLEYLFILLISVVFTSLFLNALFAIKYRRPDRYKYRFKITAIVWLSVFVMLINTAAILDLNGTHLLHFFLFELILIGIYFLILFFGETLFGRIQKFKKTLKLTWTFTHSYALMSTTRLIISSGIPVAFFFIYSFNYEQRLDTRYRQLHFAKSLVAKTQLMKKDINDTTLLTEFKKNLRPIYGVYFDDLFINSIKAIDTPKKTNNNLVFVSADTEEDLLTGKILSAMRLKISDIEIDNNNLNSSSVDGSAFFNPLNKQIGDSSPTQTYYGTDTNKYIKLSSLSHISYERPNFVFWILLTLSVFIFYYFIHQIIRKLFALNLHSTDDWDKLDNELLKNDNLNKLVLIIGSPGSNTLSRVTDWINKKYPENNEDQPIAPDSKSPAGNSAFVADMILIPTESGDGNAAWKSCRNQALSGYPIVIINHFEYNIRDANSSNFKLDLLESLISKGKCKIIIISTMHPVAFLDSFRLEQNTPVSESELGRWHMLLGNFRVLIDPLDKSKVSGSSNMPQRAIKEETQYSRFLNDMQETALKFLNKEIHSRSSEEETQGQIIDSLIYKLQLTSQYFYTDIWQSLTREEKFILYDLAEDGLVNSYDDFNLSMLICKGLITRDDGPLTLFNKSFRNFILTAIGEKEISRIKQQVRDNGKWRNLKTPLNLAILAILVFLFASQQEAYSRVVTYITALGAGIPAVLKVFSIFGGGESKKATE